MMMHTSVFRRWLGAATVLALAGTIAPAASAQPGGGGGPPHPSVADTLGIYSFTGAAGDEPTLPVDAQPTGATFSVIRRGPGVTPSVGAGAFSGTGWTMGTAPDTAQYFAFSVTAAAGQQLRLDSLVFAERRSATGIRMWQVRSSLDGFVAVLAADSVPDSTTFRSHSIGLFQTVTSVEFRIYGYAAEGTGGTWRVDNVGLIGSISPVGAATPTVQFMTTTRLVTESVGTVAIPITITDASDTAVTTVELRLATPPGTATNGDDYLFAPFTQILTFPAGSDSSQFAFIPIVDDTLTEGAETIIMTLANVSGGVIGTPNTLTITIAANDSTTGPPPAGQTPPLETIAAVTTNDSLGVALRLSDTVRVRGIITSPNTRTTGYLFSLQDATGGITLFSSTGVGPTPPPVFVMGNQIEVVGHISQFNGLTEIVPDSIRLISNLNTPPTPQVVTVLNETTESEVVFIAGPLTIPDPTQWTNTGTGFNVDVTDGVNTYTVRIVSGTDVFGTPAPTQPFSLVGIGGQFDNASPYFEGYQISPRSLQDIIIDTTANPTGPTVQFATAAASMLEANDTAMVTVTLLNPDTAAVTVQVQLATTGTATNGADFSLNPTTLTLTFAPGDSTQTLMFAVDDDALVEGNETVVLNLLNATGAALGTPATFTLTIIDNDSTINPVVKTVQFATAGSSTVESPNAVQVAVTLTNPDSVAVTVEVMLDPTGTATAGTDFTFAPATQMLTFPTGTTTRNVSITVLDDTQTEPAETVKLMLMNATGGATIGTRMMYTLTIVDNDSTPIVTPPLRSIASAVATDAQGVATMDGQAVRLRGVVTSPNVRTAGYSVTMQDASGRGITVFKAVAIGTQTIAQGDSLEVVGVIDQFNGLTEIIPDSFRTRFTNQTLPAPRVVTVLDETSESVLVKINGPLTIPTPGQWTNAAAGFNVDVTDGTTTYQLRIPRGSALIGTPAPTSAFRLTGTGGQFDNASPFLEGYQISPRTTADIELVTGRADDAANATLALYPNPATDRLTITAPAATATATVTDALGRVVLTQRLTDGAATLRVTELPAGVYSVRVGAAVCRFVKQ